MRDDHEVTELVSALEELHERARRLTPCTVIQGVQLAIAELGRHGAVALPIMQAAYHRFEARIANLEMAVI